MPPLVLEYVLEGHQRGYNFTAGTSGYSDDELKWIWRRAMPRGQGWSRYIGARSLKCFPLEEQRRVVVCDVIVTAQQDEHGRSGIRRAEIEILPETEYAAYLEQRLRSLSGSARARLERLPTFGQRLALTNALLSRKQEQLALLHPFRQPEDWQVIEGLVMKLALNPLGPMRNWGRVIPFTTLALSAQDETLLVALPTDKADSLDRKVSAVRI
jgi:hypothetical protein